MRPVFQQEVHPVTGDCMRATLASLLELDIQAVPHFCRISEDLWWPILHGFMWGCGWQFMDRIEPAPDAHRIEADPSHTFGGMLYGSMKSSNFEGCMHAVVLDIEGNVTHDPAPAPYNSWIGKNALKEKALSHYYIFKPRENYKGLICGQKS